MSELKDSGWLRLQCVVSVYKMRKPNEKQVLVK